MRKECESAMNSWKMKTGKNRKLELYQVAQGYLQVAQGSRKRPAKGVRTDRRAPLQDDFWQKKKLVGKMSKNWLKKPSQVNLVK